MLRMCANPVASRLGRLEQRVVSLRGSVSALERAAGSGAVRRPDVELTPGSGRALSNPDRSQPRRLRIRRLIRATDRLEYRVSSLEAVSDRRASGSSRSTLRTRVGRDDAGRLIRRVARRVRQLEVRVEALQAAVVVPPDPWGPGPVNCPPTAISVGPGQPLQAALDAAGPGGSLCVKPSTYRLSSPLRPLSGQTLTFEPGAILSGAKVVTAWRKQGTYWVLDKQTQDLSSAAWLRTHQCTDNPGSVHLRGSVPGWCSPSTGHGVVCPRQRQGLLRQSR